MKCPIELTQVGHVLETPGKNLGGYVTPLVFSAELNDVKLWDPGITMAFAATRNYEDYDSFTQFCSYGLTYSNYDLTSGERGVLANTVPDESSFDEASGIYIGGNDNIGHWFYNCLSKLAIVDKLGLKHPLLVRNDMLDGVRLNMLEDLLGEEYVIKGVRHNVFSAKAWLLSTPAYRGQWENSLVCAWPEAFYWMRHKMQQPLTTKRKIYVSRANCKWRRVLNEQEVVDVLKPLGYEVVDWAQMEWGDQKLAMSNCSHLVTPVAASSPISGILGPTGMKIVEFARPGMMGTFGSVLWARMFGQQFQRLICQSQPSPDDTLGTENNNDLVVDIAKLKETLSD